MTKDELVEKVAREIAPELEGGRMFDQMPQDRLSLRKWAREGMCGFNDATREDAVATARAALAIAMPAAFEMAAEKARGLYLFPPPRSRAAQFHERNVKGALSDAIRELGEKWK